VNTEAIYARQAVKNLLRERCLQARETDRAIGGIFHNCTTCFLIHYTIEAEYMLLLTTFKLHFKLILKLYKSAQNCTFRGELCTEKVRTREMLRLPSRHTDAALRDQNNVSLVLIYACLFN